MNQDPPWPPFVRGAREAPLRIRPLPYTTEHYPQLFRTEHRSYSGFSRSCFKDREGTELETISNIVWASEVAAAADLPDERLDKRLTVIVADTIERPGASIPRASGCAGQAKATYRFYGNARVAAAGLRQGFATVTAQRCLDQDELLVVQDTTTLNFTGLHTIPELGPIDSGGLAVGVHLHTALAVTASGQVVGTLDQQYWARPPPGRPGPEEKESGKWINGIDASRAVLHEAAGDRPVPRLIHVMDREGDAYEVMMTVVDAGDSAIIRCAQDRRVDDPLAKAHEAVRRRPVLGRAEIRVPRKGRVPERRARGGDPVVAGGADPGPGEVPARLADDLEPGGGVGARAAGRGRADPLAALDAGAGVDRGGGVGGRPQIHLSMADRRGALGAQERLSGRRIAAGELGRTGEGGGGGIGGGGADRVPARPGAGDPRGTGVGGVERGRSRGLGLPFRQGDEAVGTDDRPGRAVDRPPGRPPEPQAGRHAGSEDVVAWAS